MITILQGKDMAAMDSNGKLGIGLPFSTDKVCNITLAVPNVGGRRAGSGREILYFFVSSYAH